MLVNDECTSWCNRVGDFLCQFGIRGKKVCTVIDWYVRMVMSAMAVECEWFSHLFNASYLKEETCHSQTSFFWK